MKRLMILIVILMVSFRVFGQTAPVVKVDVTGSHDSVPAGQAITLNVAYQIPEKHHLTAHFFGVHLEEVAGFETGLQQVSAGLYEKGEVIRRGIAAIRVPVTVGADIQPGQYTLKGTASWQVCAEEPVEMCFPPSEKAFSVAITVLNPGEKAVVNAAVEALSQTMGITGDTDPAAPETRSLEQRLESALAGNLLLAFLLVFIGGFLTSLTPCVYPMIPITISYIGGKSSGQGKFRGFTLSLFYVLGLALVYAFLGVLAAMTGSLFGSITQTPWLIAGVAAVFGIMGLSMLGLFDIQLPSSLQGKIQSGGPRSGYPGALVMGMVAGLVAAPCAGPVIVALMTFIATTGNIVLGFTLMMSFAFGMGMLFIALGTFSGLLSALPAAGMWMEKVKKVFGIIMLAVAIFFIKSLIPPPVYGFLIGLGLLLLGTAIGAFRSVSAGDTIKPDIVKAIGLLLVVMGIYFIVSLVPVPGKIVPDRTFVDSPAQSASSSVMVWRQDLDPALNEAKSQKKPVVIDFGAEWCKACKELEHKTFADSRVTARLNTMMAVKVDCTKAQDPEVKERLTTWGVSGLPTVIILDSDGEEAGRFTSFLPPADFLKFLDQTLASDTIGAE